MMRRTRGFLLLPVALTLVVVGALAYAMTRDAGMSVARVDAAYDTEVARYLAEAAVNLARWNNNKTNCSSTPATFAATPLYRYSLATNNIGTTAADQVGTMTLNSITVIGNNSNSDKGNITVDVSSATTTSPAASQRIVRTVFRYDLTNTKQATITGSGGANTFIYTGASPTPQGTTAYMELTDNGPDQSYGLLRFSLSSLPRNALVKDATLKLKRIDGESNALPDRKLDVYRVTSAWDPVSATWSVPWARPGGDYPASEVASSPIKDNKWYTWRLDTLVAGWVDGTMANNGVLLKPTNLNKSRFNSFASGTSEGPQLTVSYYERCN
jgi:Tfp pilus assembly protein PilX